MKVKESLVLREIEICNIQFPLRITLSQMLDAKILSKLQEAGSDVFFTYQYKNQTAPSPVAITLSYGYNYLKFDQQGWPYLSDTAY